MQEFAWCWEYLFDGEDLSYISLIKKEMLRSSLYFDAKKVGKIMKVFECKYSSKNVDKHLNAYGGIINNEDIINILQKYSYPQFVLDKKRSVQLARQKAMLGKKMGYVSIPLARGLLEAINGFLVVANIERKGRMHKTRRLFHIYVFRNELQINLKLDFSLFFLTHYNY